MQDASAEFATAVAEGKVTWAKPVLLADWLDDGATELAAGQPAYLIERFDRDSSTTWGRPRDHAPVYSHPTTPLSDYTVDPVRRRGRHSHGAADTARASYQPTASESMTNWAKFRLDVAPTGAGEILADAVVHGDGTSDNLYAGRLEIDIATSTIDVKLIRREAAVTTDLATTNDALTFVAGHLYAAIVQINAATGVLRAKFWDDDIEIEPVAWTLEVEQAADVGGVYGGFGSTLPAGITNAFPYYVDCYSLRIIDGSIDDLSGLAGQIVVTQGMDDGMPNEVRGDQDQATATLDTKIGHEHTLVGLTAEQYLSQFNQNSPLYGLDRDIAPVTLEHGVITSAGPQRLRLFTGRMQDLPIGSDDLGQLVAISATRQKLSKLVQPPPFNRRGDLSATWPVSWAAYECEVYAAPNPADGCIWYAPQHGSMQPFLDAGMPLQAHYSGVFQVVRAGYYRDVGDGEMALVTFGDDPESAPAYIDGPYVAAPDLEFTATNAWGMYYDSVVTAFPSDEVANILSETGPRGRFEFCVRGDAFNSTAPSGADFTPDTFILGFFMANDTAGSVFCGINMSRELRIELSDGTAAISVSASAGFDLPTDGEWYKYGISWDFVTETAYFYRRDPDGTEQEESSTNAALDVTRLPEFDEPFASIQPFNTDLFPQLLNPYFHSFLPCAELHITGGTGANPNNAPWIWSDSYGFEPTATIRRSAIRLRAIAEVSEREAWEYISSFAQAELATIRTDENDRLLYLTLAYWAEQAQQDAGQTLSTLTNVGSLTPQIDPSRIRNNIRVGYREARIDDLHTPLYQSREVLAIPPGEFTILIPLDVPATSVDTSGATLPTSAEIASGVSSFVSGGWHTFFTINSEPDGGGTYYSGPVNPTTDPIYMQVDDAFTASLVAVSGTNRTGATLYTANTNPEVPTINIGGIGLHLIEASVDASRASSIARRGDRGLAIDVPVHQRREDAQRLAQRLLNELAEPSPTLDGVRLFGDQRRQPGDRVQFEDARGTAVGGPWVLLGIRHVIDGANYHQDTRLRQAKSVGQWQESGTSRWGSALWGREGL